MNNNKNIYFDSNASTPLSPAVIEAMVKVLKDVPGNPSSVTFSGRAAKAIVINARKLIASFLDCTPKEIVFTSGGTESICTLIRGTTKERKGAILTTSIEHQSVLDSIASTKKPIKFLEIDPAGAPDLNHLRDQCRTGAAAIVLSLVNSEIGTILPIKEIASVASSYNIPLIIDAVAALGKMPISIYPGVTAMAFSGHKCHGPKGSGFFYLKDKTPFTPLFLGGKQEHGKRAGTENTAAIAGLSRAVHEITPETYLYLKKLRLDFENKIQEIFPDCTINGGSNRICNVSNIHFKNIDGDHLLIYLDQNGISASLGSACSSGSLEPSHVLLGIGKNQAYANSSLRFSFNKTNTVEEIKQVAMILQSYKKAQINCCF